MHDAESALPPRGRPARPSHPVSAMASRRHRRRASSGARIACRLANVEEVLTPADHDGDLQPATEGPCVTPERGQLRVLEPYGVKPNTNWAADAMHAARRS
jgi:hypothetical protein